MQNSHRPTDLQVVKRKNPDRTRCLTHVVAGPSDNACVIDTTPGAARRDSYRDEQSYYCQAWLIRQFELSGVFNEI